MRTNLQDVAINTIGLSDPGVIFQIKRFNKLMRRFIPDETKIPFDQVVLVPAISYPVSLDARGTAEDFARAVFAAIKPEQKSYPTFKEDTVCASTHRSIRWSCFARRPGWGWEQA